MLDATILSSVGTGIGLVAGVATVLGLLAGGWKIIRDGIAQDVRRTSAEKAQAERVEELRKQVAKLQQTITPNGKHTDQIGDMVARIEDKVDSLGKTQKRIGDDFQRHLGTSEAEHKAFRRDIDTLKRRMENA